MVVIANFRFFTHIWDSLTGLYMIFGTRMSVKTCWPLVFQTCVQFYITILQCILTNVLTLRLDVQVLVIGVRTSKNVSNYLFLRCNCRNKRIILNWNSKKVCVYKKFVIYIYVMLHWHYISFLYKIDDGHLTN